MRREKLSKVLVAILLGFVSPAGAEMVAEASGVSIHEGRIYFVGNEADGRYFDYPLPGFSDGPYWLMPTPEEDRCPPVCKVPGPHSITDLEGIGVYGDIVVVLSETDSESVLIQGNHSHVVGHYFEGIRDLIGMKGRNEVSRGMEGLAIRPIDGPGRAEVTALFEGGWDNVRKQGVPIKLFRHGLDINSPANYEPGMESRGAWSIAISQKTLRELCPLPEGRVVPEGLEFTYRAPDLTYFRYAEDGREEWGYIVLLGATVKGFFDLKWLLRLRRDGSPLNENAVLLNLPERPGIDDSDLVALNWEGLAWSDETERALVLVADDGDADDDLLRHDDDQTTLYLLPRPPAWK